MDEKKLILETWPFINSLNWNNDSFSIEKAYVCSIYSEIAYWHIPDFELKHKNRIKVIPCEKYQYFFNEKIRFDLRDLLINSDFGNAIIIETTLAIIVIIPTSTVIIIAIRGTQKLYDWFINLDIRKHKLNQYHKVKFHRGFFKAVKSCNKLIFEKLNKIPFSENTPIYICGHSLGGAMSAILHATWNKSKISNSCYTFGMPRYTDLYGVNSLRTPFHFYNENDIVPSIPPEWLGFKSINNEYRLDENRINKIHERNTIKFIKWIVLLATFRGIKDHSIELYRTRISQLLI